ncbi:MAG: hypothetical protein KDA84_05135, partial [Planctomycetaceae bacterium]|nr:hypothetical protein [Planctomycetaceae bacterium]
MLLTDWLKSAVSTRCPVPRKTPKFGPSVAVVEVLEDRCLLANFMVTNLNDSGSGSLRQAIADANGNSNPSTVDTIRSNPALLNTSRTIGLTSGELQITQSVSIVGPSLDPGGIIINGNDNSRVFRVFATAQTALLQFMTLTRGDAGGGDGGGLLNQGPNTTVSDVIVSSNVATFGGGLANNIGQLQVFRSR